VRIASWTDPSGVVWPLNTPSAGWFAAAGAKGLGAVPRTITADERDRGGEGPPRRIQPGPRLITLPLVVVGDTEAQFEDRREALLSAFTGSDLPGQLAVARADGSLRVIDAYYAEGFDADPDLGITSDLMALTLRCPQPWFRDPTETTVVNAYSATGGRNYLSPYPAVSSGTTLGDSAVTNTGTADTWPSWTVVGPASQIVASSTTTGESWTLTPSDPSTGHGDLLAGETVTVTTDPPSVRGPSGQNWWGTLNVGAQLWRLTPGVNAVSYAVMGSAVGTTVTLTYTRRYGSA